MKIPTQLLSALCALLLKPIKGETLSLDVGAELCPSLVGRVTQKHPHEDKPEGFEGKLTLHHLG